MPSTGAVHWTESLCLLQIYMLLTPKVMSLEGDAFGRRLGHRVESSSVGLVPLEKKPQRATLPLVLREDTVRGTPKWVLTQHGILGFSFNYGLHSLQNCEK